MTAEDVVKIADRICKEVLGVKPEAQWRVQQTSQDVWHIAAGSISVVVDLQHLRFTATDYCGDAQGKGSVTLFPLMIHPDFGPSGIAA